MQFQYQAADVRGKIENGRAEADSKEQLITRLKAQGKYLLEIKESASFVLKYTGKGISDKEKLVFTQQLAGLLNAKIPLERALETLTRLRLGPKLDQTVLQLKRYLQEGLSFSAALERFSGYFPPLFISMVQVGEAGGILPRVMLKLAQYQEEEINFKRRLTGSLVYPLIVTSFTFLLVIFFVIFVIPTFQGIFQDMGTELPLITKIVLWIGTALLHFWFIPLLLIGGGIFWFYKETSTADGRYRIDQMKLKFPLIGGVLGKIATQKMAQALALLIGSGVPLLAGLKITSGLVENEVFARALQEAENRVRQGNTLGNSLSQCPAFPVMAIEMITVGEEGGNLEFMLEQVSRSYDNEIKHDLSIFLALFEPVLMFTLVAGIAILAVAILLPVLNMNSQINSGG